MAAIIPGPLLFEDGLFFEGGFNSRAAFIRWRLLFEGGFYLMAVFIRGRIFFKGALYSMASFIPRATFI